MTVAPLQAPPPASEAALVAWARKLTVAKARRSGIPSACLYPILRRIAGDAARRQLIGWYAREKGLLPTDDDMNELAKRVGPRET